MTSNQESKELPSEIESEKQSVGGAAAGDLRECRAERVGERHREHVRADTFLDAHAVRRLVRRIALRPYRDFRGDVRRTSEPHASTQPDVCRVAMNVRGFCGWRVRAAAIVVMFDGLERRSGV